MSKKYIVYQPKQSYGNNATILDSFKEVEEWLKDGSIEQGYEVYEVERKWIAIELREITLMEEKTVRGFCSDAS